jgi:hypothetical protein
VFGSSFAEGRHIHEAPNALDLLIESLTVAVLGQDECATILPVREETTDAKFLCSAVIDVPNLTLGPVNFPMKLPRTDRPSIDLLVRMTSVS